MLRLREAARRLGKTGIAFLIALLFYFVFSFTGHGLLQALDFAILLCLFVILAFRALRSRKSLWSVRNRLLFVYGLLGVLPILLLFALFGLGAWALMNELAIYLASSALDRRLDSVKSAVETVRGIPPTQRPYAAPEIVKALGHMLPGISVYVKDQTGDHRYPPDALPLQVPPGWQNVDGLLVLNSHFYGWAHFIDEKQEITTLAPLSNELVENLVPHLGVIALVETHEKHNDEPPASAGSLKITQISNKSAENPDLRFSFNNTTYSPARGSPIPPAMNRFDIPVLWPSTRPHFHLDTPGKTFEGVLWVYSRPSAVLRSFFSSSEVLRGVLFDVVVTIAFLFLLVELVAVLIGVRLSRRITRAVNQLYEGTRRVIHGDFSHRIPVTNQDQLGELSESFNQMTVNLERLLVIEKEKERLQTELEIAREVQAQLYPKEAPPRAGLQVTARCDPARMVSGDYYDYQALVHGKIAFAIGDIAGKGISAALLMATLQAALRANVSQSQPTDGGDAGESADLDPAVLVSKLNQQICAHTSPEKYATFFFALYDESSRILTYTNAGHLSPLLFRNGDVVSLDSNGTVVGAFPFSKYGESSLTMAPADLLVCYTDGITEPANAYDEEFGEQRLIELVKQHAHRDDHEIIRIVFEAVRSWTGTPELHDDMTLLLARQVQGI
ncbi:MAG: SpoIIE family protein phosphatase [Acidobacteriaceae bacterium]|nr:SpoIIE family protein phosphatase [Acidobacteriaceae bacterium]